MTEKMLFSGRVAVITGAGGGLGREYALALAKRGAMVVVNDLGGKPDGTGQSTSLADQVVKEITGFGGKAVANYNSVEDGEKVVKTAIDAFGRIDILINNAGILRDRSMVKMTDSDWDAVHRVHLRGSYKMTKAAWNYFRQQKYGRIIMTSSNAGTQGNFGQANYSAAKMGLVGLTKTLAVEGAKYGILCNTIIPLARSRMTEGLMPEEMGDILHPKYVAPIVLYLCHEACPSSGDIYMSAGGVVQKVRLQNSVGYQFLGYGEDFGPEHIQKHWAEIETFGTEEMPKDANQILMNFIERARKSKSSQVGGGDISDNLVGPEKLIGRQGDGVYEYTFKQPIMYAISVGTTLSENDTSDLRFLYENDENFTVLPTFGVIPAMFGIESIIGSSMSEAGLDLTQLLHGEQYTELFKPLPTHGTLKSTGRIADVLDKGKGLVMIVDVDTFNENGEKVMYNQTSLYIHGAGGFGGRRTTTVEKQRIDPPKRTPDHVVEDVIPNNQAALYRLNQDANPLHIDPQMAQIAGFKSPILHGLCTYGYAARHILKTVGGNDVAKFRRIKGRFSGSVYPGQTIATQMWIEGKRVHFEVLVKDTQKKAISGGYVDLDDVTLERPSQGPAKEPAASGSTADDIFAEIQSRLQSSPDIAKSFNAVVMYKITKDGESPKTWILDLKGTSPKIFQGRASGQVDCSVTATEDDFVAIARGKLNPLKAYMSGKLKTEGNVTVLQKMNKLFSTEAKL